jgi:hypothetical protein
MRGSAQPLLAERGEKAQVHGSALELFHQLSPTVTLAGRAGRLLSRFPCLYG